MQRATLLNICQKMRKVVILICITPFSSSCFISFTSCWLLLLSPSWFVREKSFTFFITNLPQSVKENCSLCQEERMLFKKHIYYKNVFSIHTLLNPIFNGKKQTNKQKTMVRIVKCSHLYKMIVGALYRVVLSYLPVSVAFPNREQKSNAAFYHIR